MPNLNVFRPLKPFQSPNLIPPTLKKFESFPWGGEIVIQTVWRNETLNYEIYQDELSHAEAADGGTDFGYPRRSRVLLPING